MRRTRDTNQEVATRKQKKNESKSRLQQHKPLIANLRIGEADNPGPVEQDNLEDIQHRIAGVLISQKILEILLIQCVPRTPSVEDALDPSFTKPDIASAVIPTGQTHRKEGVLLPMYLLNGQNA